MSWTEQLQHERFSVDAKIGDGTLNVIFSGEIDLKDPGPVLNPFFDKAHAAALEASVSRADLDFRGLKFLNSSGIKSLIRWVLAIRDEDKHTQYTMRILSNPEITWQHTSFHVLRVLSSPELVKIEHV